MNEDKENSEKLRSWLTKKKLIAIGLIVVLVTSTILLLFIFNPHNNSFTVSFNGKIKNGITAVTYTDENHTIVNEEFKSLFARNLASIANDSLFVGGITIEDEYWFWIINAGVVRVDGKGWYVLEAVKNKIEDLWYVESVTYNDLAHVALK